MSRSLRVVVAPDSFGGALDSVGVAASIATGWSRVRPDDEILQRPMADGGEGTLAAVAAALGDAAELRTVETTDALGRPITADWLLFNDGRGAFIEMAAASGLARLAPAERAPENARRASTRGTGDLVRAALDADVERITIGLGGSATTDGGAGLLCALGVRLLDASGTETPEGGAALARLDRIDAAGLDPRLAATRVVIASDVTNPLCGPRGAAATYGPQKGADPAAVAELDAALAKWGADRGDDRRLVADIPGPAPRVARPPACSASRRRSCGRASRSSLSWLGWRRHSSQPTSSSLVRAVPTSRPSTARRLSAWRPWPGREGRRSFYCAAASARVPRRSTPRHRSPWSSRSPIGRWSWRRQWPRPSVSWLQRPGGWRGRSASVCRWRAEATRRYCRA